MTTISADTNFVVYVEYNFSLFTKHSDNNSEQPFTCYFFCSETILLLINLRPYHCLPSIQMSMSIFNLKKKLNKISRYF